MSTVQSADGMDVAWRAEGRRLSVAGIKRTSMGISQKEPGQGLRGSFGSAMSWNIAEMAVSQSIVLGVIIFLEWRLGLRVFGLFALSVVFIDLIYQQGRSASVDTLMQGRDFSQRTLSSAFFAMLGMLLLTLPVLCVYGYYIADLNNEPVLKWMVPALALTLLPLPLGVPPTAKLNHALDFKGIAIRGILAAGLGGGAAIAVALGPHAEWALVAQRGVAILASVGFLMLRAKWVPSIQFDSRLASGFLRDMWRIFFAQGLAALVIPILYLVVGRYFGTAAVGALRIASKFAEMIYGAIAAPMGSLWVIFQTRQAMTAQEKRGLYVDLSKMAAMVCLPVFAGGALIAEDLVALLLSDRAGGVANLLIVFCVIGLAAPVFYFRNHAFTALGRLNELILFAIADVSITAIAALATAHFGAPVEAVAASLGLHFCVSIILFTPILLREMETRLSRLIAAMTPAYIAVFAMAMAVMVATDI
ncbi:MAG: oligosaccharide flippase family protein, partial [Pseudomonadota bacterium]